MTVEGLKAAVLEIEDYFGKDLPFNQRKARSEAYSAALKDIPDWMAAQALTEALKVCRFPQQLLVDWWAEIKKIQAAQAPTANDLWKEAATAARKIGANLYYQTHGGLMTTEGKLTGEDFKRRNAEIFAALPVAVQRWAGSPADLSEIFSSRSSADLRQFVRPGFDRAVQDAPVESLQPPALPGGATQARIGGDEIEKKA